DLLHNMALASERGNKPEKAARYWAEVINRWKARLKNEPENEYLRECIIEAHRHHGLQFEPQEQRRSSAAVPTGAVGAGSGNNNDRQMINEARRERLKSVLELKPDDFDSKFQLASSYVEERRYDEALRELEELHRKHPKNVEVLNLLAWAELNSGSVDKAFNTWNKSLAIDPKNPST